MEKKIKILPPMMPNYLSYDMPPRTKQAGFDMDANKIEVGDLTREEAEEYGELMKQTFIKHWESKQKEGTLCK